MTATKGIKLGDYFLDVLCRRELKHFG